MMNRGRDPPAHHGHTESGWESMASVVARRRTPIKLWEASQFRGLAGAQGQLSFETGCSIRIGDASPHVAQTRAVDAPPAALSRCLKDDNPWLQRRLDSITQSLTDRDHVSPASSEHQSDQSGHATDDITARILSVMDEGAAADRTTNRTEGPIAPHKATPCCLQERADGVDVAHSAEWAVERAQAIIGRRAPFKLSPGVRSGNSRPHSASWISLLLPSRS